MTAENANSFSDRPAPPHSANIALAVSQRQPTVFLVAEKSKNKNIVVYEALIREGKLCDPPVIGYSLILDQGADYQPKRRAQGIQHDRSPLNELDLKFAWGYGSKRISDTEAEFWFTNLPEEKFRVVLEKGKARCLKKHQDKDYLFRSMFVEASDHIHLLDLRRNLRKISFRVLDITDPRQPKHDTIYWQ